MGFVCRYTDSPDGDWMIGYYPSDSGLLLATSGSGHAFKARYWVLRFYVSFDLPLGCRTVVLTSGWAYRRGRHRRDARSCNSSKVCC